jgi:hypothetical protein
MTHRHLKGSRKLQLPGFPTSFKGGSVSGFATGGGSAGGSGSVTGGDVLGTETANGSGDFSVTGGSSGFVNTIYGDAQGSAAAGATGSQTGAVKATLGVGTVEFGGTTDANGAGSFGAGFSPVGFKAVTRTIPGTAIESQGSKKGGSTLSLPTTVTNFVPFSTGPTGGFGAGTGGININSGSTGTLMGIATIGSGSSTGGATSFGGGSGTASNDFGSAGGLGSGAATGDAIGGGTTTLDQVNGMFTGLGTSNTNFNNAGSGSFGRGGSITFP